jgi:hypothetical protein
MTDPCFDAEVLAAWADGTLDERAAAEVERHGAQCARCQAMLAAFVRTEPATAPAAARVPGMAPWWQSLRLRWLVPMAAAATAVAIWIAVPTSPTLETDLAEAPERAAAPPDAPAVPGVAATQPQTAVVGRPAPVGAALDAAPLATEAGAREKREERQEAPRDGALTRERTDATASAAERREAPLPAAAPTVAAEAAPQGRSQAALRALADNADRAIEGFDSRDGAVRWRLAGPGIARSTDGGATWIATQVVAPAAPAAALGAVASVDGPVAGDAPSAAVCWLVGPGGAVWLTTDGGQGFRRLTVPGGPDLRAVTARDARSADVTASDGRVFRTGDAGGTWILVP